MSDIAEDIRKAVDQGRPPPRSAASQDMYEEAFMKLRAKVRGTLIAAHRELIGDEWLVNDDRILDIIDTWLAQKRGK
jgi:hypothetical protein